MWRGRGVGEDYWRSEPGGECSFLSHAVRTDCAWPETLLPSLPHSWTTTHPHPLCLSCFWKPEAPSRGLRSLFADEDNAIILSTGFEVWEMLAGFKARIWPPRVQYVSASVILSLYPHLRSGFSRGACLPPPDHLAALAPGFFWVLLITPSPSSWGTACQVFLQAASCWWCAIFHLPQLLSFFHWFFFFFFCGGGGGLLWNCKAWSQAWHCPPPPPPPPPQHTHS